MSRRLLLSALVVLCSVSFSGAPGLADETQTDQQKMMETYMKLMAIGPNHDYFKDFVGMWDVKTTAWMAPGTEPMVTDGRSESELILGGRFLATRFSALCSASVEGADRRLRQLEKSTGRCG
jgi:predicted metal-binding membrane protein